MRRPAYSTCCALLSGLGACLVWTSYTACVFIAESALHSVHQREPERIGAHDGYYGQAVSNLVYMVTTLVVPSLMNYFRCKWILALSGSFFTLYFVCFQFLNRYLYFTASILLGCAFSTFNLAYTGYITEFSTRQTMERNYALSWSIGCLNTFGAGVVNFIVTTLYMNDNVAVSKFREYSDTEIRYFFAALILLGTITTILFACLPNQEVENNIAASNVRCATLKEQLSVMLSLLVDKRILILVPFYLYMGLFFSFWISIVPTAIQFTKALSTNVYLPAYFAFAVAAGSIAMSLFAWRMSTVVTNFSFKPLMIINFVVHMLSYALTVCLIPEWSTVRPNEEPSLLIEPSIFPVLVLAFLFGAADAANSSTRSVMSSLLIPTRRQHTVGASRFFHALAASILFFASPALSIYSYVIMLSIILVVATIVYLYTCDYIQKEERRSSDEIGHSNKALDTVE